MPDQVSKTIGRLPVYQGDFDPARFYLEKNRVTLYGSEFESLEDNNNTPPATLDETNRTIAFNTAKWKIISNGSDAWLASYKIAENTLDIEELQDASESAAYLAEDEGEAEVADFDPEADTVWNKPQTLSSTQKQQARQNLGLGDGTIDDEPTARSENLVKSGGVFESISKINYIDKTQDIVWTPNYIIDYRNGGQQYASGKVRTDYIDVSDVSKVLFNVLDKLDSTTFNGYAFYNSEQTFISGGYVSTLAEHKNCLVEVVVPSNAKYLRFCIGDEQTYGSVVFKVYGKIENIENNIRSIEYTLYPTVEYYSRSIVTPTGKGSFGLNGCVVGLFNVEENTKYVFQTDAPINPNVGQAVGVVFMDKNKNVISNSYRSFVYNDIKCYIAGLKGYKFISPVSACYCYLTINNQGNTGIEDIDTIKLIKFEDITSLDKTPLNILVLGDSISATAYQTDVNPWNIQHGNIGGWISEYFKKIGIRPLNWINYSVGGYTLSDNTELLNGTSFIHELEDAITDYNNNEIDTPDIIMIAGCTNDIELTPRRNITKQQYGDDYDGYAEHTFFTPETDVNYNHYPLIPLADISKAYIIGALRYIIERAGTVWPNCKFVVITPPQSTRKNVVNQIECVRDMKWAANRLCIPVIDVWGEAQMPMLWDYNADWTNEDLQHRFLDDGVHTYDTNHGSNSIGYKRQGEFIARRMNDIFKEMTGQY